MRRWHCTLALVLAAAPGWAAKCPAPPDRADELTRLIAAVQAAPDAMSAQPHVNRMWAIWADAPDPYAQELLDEGMTRRAASDYAGAMAAFDALVAYCPDYAEGYNQRAFVKFIRRDYGAALPDLERALALSPRPLGAMSGQALTLIALGRKAEAALALRAALEINPWLPERDLLPALAAGEDAL